MLVVQRSNNTVYPILRSLRGNENITSMSVSYFSSKEVCAKFTKLYTERNQCTQLVESQKYVNRDSRRRVEPVCFSFRRWSKWQSKVPLKGLQRLRHVCFGYLTIARSDNIYSAFPLKPMTLSGRVCSLKRIALWT
jgi:hypothetical protein